MKKYLATSALVLLLGIQGAGAAGPERLHNPPNKISLTAPTTTTELGRRACRLTVRLWNTDDPGWKYSGYLVSFTLVSGAGPAPAATQTDTNGEIHTSVPKGTMVKAVVGPPANLTSVTAGCPTGPRSE